MLYLNSHTSLSTKILKLLKGIKMASHEKIIVKKVSAADSAMAPRPTEASDGSVPTPIEPLPGYFAILTNLKGRYLTAVGGGGRTTDVIHTNKDQFGELEKFKLWVDTQTRQNYAFQTQNGHFLTAKNAGGLITNAIVSTATNIAGDEMFKLIPYKSDWYLVPLGIQTLRGYFLTAVGGGGHDTGDTIHTDAMQIDDWEKFKMYRCGDLGSGSTYSIEENGGTGIGGWLTAIEGGRRADPSAVTNGAGTAIPFQRAWTLLLQNDGSFAFQTSSGNYLTANGGGIGGGFRTDATTIQNWEKFTVVKYDDCNFYIKTYAGYYLSVSHSPNPPLNDRINTVTDIKKASLWRFWVFGL